MSRRILVLGGTRSGKSVVAETRLREFGGSARYIATGQIDPADPEFGARVNAHRARRPSNWRTTESSDLLAHLRSPAGPTLVDDLGSWLARAIDSVHGWEAGRGTVDLGALCTAVIAYPDPLVLVSPEVGLSVIPPTRAGRLFADELGTLNQRMAAICDEVLFVVAGLPQRLK